MSKNVLIYSDGTGQAGGLFVDETRSNDYKLYRGTRVGACGPDAGNSRVGEKLRGQAIRNAGTARPEPYCERERLHLHFSKMG